jgi:ABC-type polysaccharide/polyol phosphate transport system ATPase subunit
MEGMIECKAKTDFGNVESVNSINIVTNEFQLDTNYPYSKIEMIQDEKINYSIIATANTDIITNNKIKVPIPPNIELKSFKVDGKYDSSTGIWEVEFENKKARLHLCINGTSPGNFTQNIEIDGKTILNKECTIFKEELKNLDQSKDSIISKDSNLSKGSSLSKDSIISKDLGSILEKIPPSGMQFLEDGENIVFGKEFDKFAPNENFENKYYSNNENIAIKVEDLSMEFTLNHEKIDNIKEYFIKFIKREIKQQKFLALDNVSFSLDKGDRLGIVGLNGAGKSTLLKIIAGVMKPTRGSIHVNGKIAPLLELGAGFDPNYTGKENIFLNGSILGYSKEFIQNKFDEIAEFSELGKFLDIPIKNYSSGMKSKLGFSVATIVEPDILILDEVLSVGDVKFRKKSGDKIKSLFNSGVTVLLVSHSIGQVRDLCNRAIWLENGKIIMEGSANDVCDAYEDIIN